MPISETVYFAFAFSLTVIFSVFGFFMEKYMYKMFFKITAGLCWFILALMLFIVGDLTSALTVPFTYFFGGIGIIFFLLTIFEWNGEKKDRFEREASM